ncbi:hypothetical protein FRC17_011079 [Serendipita sp. 399]|nr:hypothetical protein FRC17_011079 [Serendipita sp. 399]
MVAISVLDGQIKTHLKQWDTPLTPDMGEWCEAIIQAVQPNQDILRVFPWQIYTTALIFAPEGNLMKEASLQPWVPSVKKLNQPLSFVANNMLVGLNVPVKLVGHKGPVTCLAYSPDHRYLASGSEDHTAILWHSKFGVMSSLLRGHTAHITCLQFSPSSPILLSGSRDGTLRRWNIRTGASIEPVWKSHGEVRSLAFSPDGRRVLYGTATGGLFLIDSETGEILRPQFGSHSAAVTSIVLSPDRSLVATSSLDGTLDIWRWTGMMEHVSKVTHTSAITAATFLPDNSSIAFAATGIHVWDLAQQQVSSFEGYEEATFTSLIVTPNRMMLIGGLDDTGQLIQWWTLDERSKLGLAVHGKNTWGKVTSLVYNPVAASIASASTDGTVFLWSSDFANRVFNTGRARDARSMAFSKDGRFLAVGFPNAIKTERAVLVWDTTSGKLVRELRTGENASAIAFFPDGETIVCGSSERDLAVWKPDNTLMIAGFLRGSWQSPLIKCIGISDTGSHLATGTGSSIKVWCLVEPDGSQSPEWPRLVHTINCRSEPGSGVGFLWDMSALAYGSQAWDLLSDPPRSIQEEDEEARRREVVWEVFPHLVRFSKYEGKQHGRYWIHFGGQPPMMSMALPAEFKLGACAIHQEKVAYAADEEEVYVMDFTKMIQHALGTA